MVLSLSGFVGNKKLLDDLRVTAAQLMLLVYKLLLSVLKVNAAWHKLTAASEHVKLQLDDEEGYGLLAKCYYLLKNYKYKTTAWNEFSSTMASAIICLATNQKFNFSKYIFESMVKNLDNADEVVNEEMDDSLQRAAITATGLDAEQDRGNINKTQSKATPNEPSSLGLV
ncbi:hypothetical protein Tco_1522316 [Tanacetum coccineum]